MEIPGTASSSNSVASSLDGRSSVTSGGNGGSDFLNLSMFGQPSTGAAAAAGVSDLLLGATAGIQLGSNGYANNNDSASSTQNPAPSSFDINDFPSLGGGISGASASNGLVAVLRQQQQQHQQQQVQQMLVQQQLLGIKTPVSTATSMSIPNSANQPTSVPSVSGSAPNSTTNLYRMAMQGGTNFTMANEDFPALPTGGAGGNGSSLLMGGSNGGQTTASAISAANAFGSLSGRPSSGTPSLSGIYAVADVGTETSTSLDGVGSILGSSGLSGGLGGLTGVPQQSGSGLSTLQQQQLQQQQQQQQQQHQNEARSWNAPAPSMTTFQTPAIQTETGATQQASV